MWSSWLANQLPTAARPSSAHRGRRVRTIISISTLRAPLRFVLFSLLLSFISQIVQPESHHRPSLSQQDDYTDGSISSSPILDAATATEDPTFITAQGSSFFIGDGQGDTSSLSYNTDCQSKEDLAGSYHYTATGATPPEVQPAGRSSPNGQFVLNGKC